MAAGLTQVLSDGTNTYLYGNGRISQHATQTEYFLGDVLGSVRQLVDTAGAVTLTQSYAPYGETISSVGSGTNSYQFTGEARDANGLIYLRARYYNPGDGRFLSRDTWAGNYNRPLSLNRWGYVEGNPVNYIDPTGRIKQGQEDLDAQAILSRLTAYNINIIKDWGEISINTHDLIDSHLRNSCGWNDGAWEFGELKDVEAAMMIMVGGIDFLGGNFKSTAGPVTIRRATSSHVSTTKGHTITVRDTTSQEYRLYMLVHEMGHIVRNHTQSTNYFKEELGVRCYDKVTNKDKAYCYVGRGNDAYDPGLYAGEVSKNYPYIPSQYALKGIGEDYAETFTVVVTGAYIRSGNTTYFGEAGKIYIDRYVSDPTKTVNIGKRWTVMEAILDGTWK